VNDCEKKFWSKTGYFSGSRALHIVPAATYKKVISFQMELKTTSPCKVSPPLPPEQRLAANVATADLAI
jgi:hypothetical protein